MLKQFLRHLSEKNLIAKHDRILLAVSGGLDSMVMLNLFVKGGFNIGVAHCNFQLRGDESDKDAAFVETTCANLSIPCFTKQLATDNHAKQHKLSIQMAARELRYTWFASVAELHNFQHIATAHHTNDSIETTLFNWTNGTGLYGLTGIAYQNKNVIRPLLWFSRDNIEKYAIENSIAWREDASNSSDDYARNFIRHKIVPFFKELNPNLESTFLRGQRKLKSELAFLNRALDDWKLKFVQLRGNEISIDKKAVSELGSGAGILQHILSDFDFSFDVCEEICESLGGQSGKKFMSATHLLVIDRDKLLVAKHHETWQEIVIEAGDTETILGSFILKSKNSTNCTPSQSTQAAVLDIAKIKYPLRWRTWREGDFFYPLGMEHKKKVSDFLIDSKVPVSEKQRVTVLECSEGIVWVVGHRIDNRFKITDTSTHSLIVSVSSDFR